MQAGLMAIQTKRRQMLTDADCLARAERKLAQIARECAEELGLLPNPFVTAQTLAYFYQTTDYLRTGDAQQALAGNGPILVNRFTGAVGMAGTALPIEEYLREFEMAGQGSHTT